MNAPVTVWRLCAEKKVYAAFSGEGAFRRGGRWNFPGTRVAYCSESRALAAIEVMVHVEGMEDFGALSWRTISVTIPCDAVERPLRYPPSWRAYPYARETQEFGSEWASARRAVALRVPSAVVVGEFNFLINPEHADFKKLEILRPELFEFDPRLGA